MEPQIKAIPEGYHSLTPYLMVPNASQAIEFYEKAFGATEIFRISATNGKVQHCELRIGDSIIMLADELPNVDAGAGNGRAFSLLLYVEDVDAAFKKATDAGAKILRPLKNEYYGDRMGTLQDPFGNHWHFASHIEDVSPEEMEKRSKQILS
jgi:PhnB protein